MDSVGEIIMLLGGVLILSGVLGVFITISGGQKDLTHLMLPSDVFEHLSHAWDIFDVVEADLSPHGYLKLRVRSSASEVREMLVQRLFDGFTSCLYDPTWHLQASASYSWDPRALAEDDSQVWLSEIIDRQAQSLKFQKGSEKSTELTIDYSLPLVSDESDYEKFTLRLFSVANGNPLWIGKAIVAKSDVNSRHDQSKGRHTFIVEQLFEMLATRTERAG